jgi:hypothetical protein
MPEVNGIGVSRKRPEKAKKPRLAVDPDRDSRSEKVAEILKPEASPQKSGQKIPITEEALFKDWDNEDDEWWNTV